MINIDPVIFSDGKKFYERLAVKYRKHEKGYFILAPSGAGKTYFCNNQSEPDWIDGDELWMGAGAHPDIPWWTMGNEVINKIDKRSDVITQEAMDEGFWIIGASNFWLQPSAIVIPDWETHKLYIKKRHEGNYDGGATPDDHEQVLEHIETIKKWHTDYGVPLFKSVNEAAEALVKDL